MVSLQYAEFDLIIKPKSDRTPNLNNQLKPDRTWGPHSLRNAYVDTLRREKSVPLYIRFSRIHTGIFVRMDWENITHRGLVGFVSHTRMFGSVLYHILEPIK